MSAKEETSATPKLDMDVAPAMPRPLPLPGRRPANPSIVPACPACRSDLLRYAFSLHGHRLVRCADCGAMLLNPQPFDEELATIYKEDYALLSDTEQGLLHTADLKRRTARHYLDLIASYRGSQGGHLLEIGCGQGALIHEAALLGYQVVGMDVSPHACRLAQSRIGAKGRVICGMLEAVDEPLGSFDVIVLADVIEHVRNPAAMLARLHTLLKRGGTLFIATPALDSWSAKLLRHRWMEFKLEHLTYFNRNNIQTLLLAQGYEQLLVTSNKKYLSAAYVNAHFERYRIPVISPLVSMATAMLPASWRLKPQR